MDFWVWFWAVLGGVKIGTVFLKKLGSDLVVRSSRYELSVQLFALYHQGSKIREKNSLHFWVEIGTVFLKKLGSDLVVQSSR